MPYIKSHSNYALKKKHQIVDDGTVFERDITTIGAVNQFAPGQTPIYRSGNFIITVRADRGGTNQYNTQKWEQSNNSGETWTLSNISGMTSKDENQDDTKIVLKNDYYDFRDFAYYGSLTELFRSSMNDILDRFPGELYCISGNGETGAVYYTSSYTEDLEAVETNIRLGGSDFYEVSNPYGINIHAAEAPKEADPLKYFANGGYKNYTINGNKITSWKSEYYYSEKIGKNNFIRYTATTDSSAVTTASSTTYYPCKGDKVAEITLNGENAENKKIYVYLGDDNVVYYLHKAGQNDVHITPDEGVIADFYNGCSDLERIILNPNTSPKYKATFSVISEDDYGYTRELEEFVFPTSAGGYNPATESGYVDRLVTIGEFYDENLTDNLYRSMTHEAIKNFDWSYTREYDEDAEEEHFEGGQKIQKALRIFAREFDEQKKYIDNIKNTGRITYDDRANIPDYFLADVCEDDGWDIKSVIPYDLKETWEVDGKTVEVPSDIYSPNSGETYQIHNASGKTIDDVFVPTKYFNREYSQSSKSAVTPYNSSYIGDGTNNGYFIQCSSGGTGVSGYLSGWYGTNITAAVADETYKFMFPSDRIEHRIKPYSDDTSGYTYMDINNEFLKRLKLNSRAIWRHKGTLEGIEMILGMFGLKSKRWIDKTKKDKYDSKSPDYEIVEYTQFTKPIKDTLDNEHNMYTIDWINSTKTITYDNRATSNYTLPGSMGSNYIPYQGLPVAYLDKSDGRYLYPNFNKNEQLDGNPYFQMDGGWLAKTIAGKQNFQFDADDNIVHCPVSAGTVTSGFVIDNQKLYKETVRSIRRVESLRELLSIPQSELYDGIICYVGRIDNETAIIDGEAFTIEHDGNDRYVRLTRSGGFVKVGGLYFDEDIVVLGKDGDNLSAETYSLDDKLDGYEIKAYIASDDTFVCKSATSDQYSVNNFKIVKNNDSESGYSNYFKLNDTVFSDMITYSQSEDGWVRLKTSDRDYRKINTIYNYYEGNNGHNGNMKYDSGHEYFTYFQRLFKYAEDNDLFDTRCYGEGYNHLYENLHPSGNTIGFSGLIHPNEDVTDYDNYISADTKVHYFGNYKKAKWCVSAECFSSTTEAVICKKKNKAYSATPVTNNIDKIYIYGTDYSIGTGNTLITGEKQPHTSSDPITNQIVNNKRIRITFNMKKAFASKDGQIELKYIDDIVMNYLTQLIPSTAIVDIEYNFSEFTDNTTC
jgi:hypothetical protein